MGLDLCELIGRSLGHLLVGVMFSSVSDGDRDNNGSVKS